MGVIVFVFTIIIEGITAGFRFDLDYGRSKVPFPVGRGGRSIDVWVCDCNVRFCCMIGFAEGRKRRRGSIGKCRLSIRRERLG